MPNPYFRFKQFTVFHDKSAMKVTTDACLFGAWCASELQKLDAKNVLDIGAGTGLLSLMILQKNKLHIDAIEIDREAVQQAKENADATNWKESINIIQGNILESVLPSKYDCIISNPPFYENELISQTAKKNLAHHSAALGLSGLLSIIKKGITNPGYFFLLLPYKRANEIQNLIKKEQLFIHKKILVRPSTLHAPFRIMLMGSNQEKTAEDFVISIKNEQDEYTEEFTGLLREYYLYL